MDVSEPVDGMGDAVLEDLEMEFVHNDERRLAASTRRLATTSTASATPP